ncbi:Hr1 repeat [Popillia japonica]|uniref:Hr1 repeat n=1 Tax=Popillia japonica TaxID=7064 RepID=A0AAW1LDC3_POPJA
MADSYYQDDYIRHPVLYELSHKYGLDTENLPDSMKLEALKEIIKREIRKELKIKEGAEKLREVSTDRKSVSNVNAIVKSANLKLADLKNELSELESQIILTQGHSAPSTPPTNGEPVKIYKRVYKVWLKSGELWEQQYEQLRVMYCYNGGLPGSKTFTGYL